MATSLALIITPGPSVVFVVSRAIAWGRRAALMTVLDNAAGFYLQVTTSAFGIGVLVQRSVLVFPPSGWRAPPTSPTWAFTPSDSGRA